jgi:uncharacterized membrane protein
VPNLRQAYDLPERPPIPYRVWATALFVIALALGLWLLLPESPLAVVIVFVVVLTAVFGATLYILRDHELEEPPPLHPVPPPSVADRADTEP